MFSDDSLTESVAPTWFHHDCLHVSTAESLSTRLDLQEGRGRAKYVCSRVCYLVVSKDGMCGMHSLRKNMVYM